MMKLLVKKDGQYKGMAETLERVMPLDNRRFPARHSLLHGLSLLKCLSFSGKDSQVKSFPPGVLLTFSLGLQPLYILLEEGGGGEESWNDQPRGFQPAQD